MIFYMWCGKNCYSISYIILFITVKKIENRSIFNRNIAKYSSAILETRYIGACPNYSEIFLPVYTRLGYAPLIQQDPAVSITLLSLTPQPTQFLDL